MCLLEQEAQEHYSIAPLLHCPNLLELLSDLLELVTLDDIAYLIFGEIAELYAAFET